MNKSRSKYRAIPTGGYASKLEARRAGELSLLQRSGQISELKEQVAFVLAPSVRLLDKKRARPAMRLIVDFTYKENGSLVLEDAKGFETPMSLAKRHLLKHVHGLDVRIYK